MPIDKKKIIELEKEAIMATFRRKSDVLEERLSDDFVEISNSGMRMSKSFLLKHLPAVEAYECNMSSAVVQELGEGACLITYLAEVQKKGCTQSTCSWRCSVWRKNGENWQMVFHQGTLTTENKSPTACHASADRT